MRQSRVLSGLPWQLREPRKGGIHAPRGYRAFYVPSAGRVGLFCGTAGRPAENPSKQLDPPTSLATACGGAQLKWALRDLPGRIRCVVMLASRLNDMKGFARLLLLAALVLRAPFVFAEDISKDLIAKAEHGDAVAQFELGEAYEGQISSPDAADTPEGKKSAAEAVRWFRRAAEQGYIEAEKSLAANLSIGWGVPEKDAAEAAKWLRKAADQGDGSAAFDLGIAYSEGNGVPKDGTEAVKWFRKADQGSAVEEGTAEVMLGFVYEKGDCVPKDDDEAMRWFRKAAEHGNAGAQDHLGRGYMIGNGVPKDTAEAIKWFQLAASAGNKDAQGALKKLTGQVIKSAFDELRAKAENGDAKAQLSLALAYSNWKGTLFIAWRAALPEGVLVPKRMAEAIKWFRKAADQGYSAAEYCLGLAYEYGDGVPKDDAEALKCFRKAANHGLPEAQDKLGSMYDEGYEVPKDLAESAKWYRMAADNGDVRAQVKMGDLSFRRDDNNFLLPIPEERKAMAAEWYQKAAEHYRTAAEHGDADAQYRYGNLLAEVAKAQIKNYSDEEETRYSLKYRDAAFWYMKAAYKGHSRAQLALAYQYLFGEGVAQNDIEGTAWKIIGAAGADEITKDSEMDELKRQELDIGPDKMRLAQERSNEILAKIVDTKGEGYATAKSSSDQGEVPEDAPKSSGSGAIVSSQGHVLTAAHVVAGANSIKVVTSQGVVSATVLSRDEANDIAVLKIAGGPYVPLAVATSRGVRLGQGVATIGFPNVEIQGFSPKVARGEISSLNGVADDPRDWQISVPVQPGNSGGPLLNEGGSLIGVVESKLGLKAAQVTGDMPQNVSYAVKSAYALALLEPYLESGAPEPNPAGQKQSFEDMVAKAQQSVVLILVY